MHRVTTAGWLQIWANAKLNFYLEILGKRPDGYHELSTFMVPVGLQDVLEFRKEESDKIELWCDSKELSTGPENLIIRAARMMQEESKKAVGAKIRLFKRIPMAAGLGGGSSNAAATLIALNQLWNLNLSLQQLLIIAAQLGSDVPFFLYDSPAWCLGRGEKISPSSFFTNFSILIVKPYFGLSTPKVYSQLKIPSSPMDQTKVEALLSTSLNLQKALFNRLQEPAIQLEPALQLLLDSLSSNGAKNPMLSGSGSAIFVLFENDGQALLALKKLLNGPAKNIIQHTFITRQAFNSCVN